MSSEPSDDPRFDPPASIADGEHNLDDHGPNNHLTLIYEGREEQFATAIPFVQQGLEQGDRCLYVADDNDEETVARAMREAGIDVEAAVESGLLSIQSASDVYLDDDGEFDADEIIAYLDETVTEAITERGYEHVRITGEMTWVLNGEDHFDALAEYERKVNHFYPGKDVTGLCQYNRERFPARVLHDVIRSHPQVVYEDTLSQNFFYNPPERFFDEEFESEVDQCVETLLRQARATHALAERERGLSVLTDAARGLFEASRDDVASYAVRNVQTILDTPHAAMCEYDGSERALCPCTTAHEERAFDPERYHDRIWETFVTNETSVLRDLPDDDPMGSLLVVPLGRHGVLVAAATDPRAFDDADVHFAETVGANVRAAFDRAERNEILDERERTLSEQSDLVGRLERVSELVRDTTRAVREATTRAEIREVVCDRLARSGSYEFVWFGDYDAATDGLVPRSSAGLGRGYLDAVDPESADGADGEPAALAAETREIRVVEDVLDRSPTQSWQREAFKRGFQSVAAIPVAYDGVLYGVVATYAADVEGFDDVERAVLAELGETIGFAINAFERKQALVDDRVVELELRITDSEFTAVEFARETGATYEFHGVVPHDDGFRIFAAARGGTVAEMRAFSEESLVVESADVVAERDDQVLFEYTADESGVVPHLLNHGVTPTRLSADEEGATLVLSLPTTVDVAAFLQMLRRNYSGVDLLAKRSRDRGYHTTERFHTELEELLSPRQREALQMAYYSGYFDWPRASTGEEVAERMGISQPTFNRHLREGSRKLFWKLFEDENESAN
jgi:predicted DNA binding protein/KaiC/GvpD/RAD55 family RecA-like ATPase/putative methionine-R-sulfoxide reductase with GAF domain